MKTIIKIKANALKEYYYIDFKCCEIFSWCDEKNDFDKANKKMGNYFSSFIEARDFIKELLKRNS